MTAAELQSANERAKNILDRWLNVTGIVPKESGYYYEMLGVVEDAVQCGAQAALGLDAPLPSEWPNE